MKNKLTMLTLAGALALTATAPFAMAANQKGASARSPRSTASVAKVSTSKAAVRMSASRAAVPPHTILNGAKKNPF